MKITGTSSASENKINPAPILTGARHCKWSELLRATLTSWKSEEQKNVKLQGELIEQTFVVMPTYNKISKIIPFLTIITKSQKITSLSSNIPKLQCLSYRNLGFTNLTTSDFPTYRMHFLKNVRILKILPLFFLETLIFFMIRY